MPRSHAPSFTSEPLRGTELCDGVLIDGADVSVGPGATGLRASRAFSKGDVVFCDQPLAFAQSTVSSFVAPACLGCGAVLGGSLRQVCERVLAGCSDEAVTQVLGSKASGCGLASLEHLDGSGMLDDARFRLPEALPCPGRCGAHFCSEQCKDAQTARGHHRLLCTDLPHARKPAWEEFCRHARRTHETFVLAAYLISQALCDVLHGGLSPGEVLARYTGFWSIPWPDTVQQSADDRWRRRWVQKRWRILEVSHRLLLDVLGGHGAANMEELLSLEGYSRLVGMLDLVCKDVSVRNPLDVHLEAELSSLSIRARTDFRKLALTWVTMQGAHERAEEPMNPEPAEEAEDGSSDGSVSEEGPLTLTAIGHRLDGKLSLLPPYNGYGLLPRVALCNHSCGPNVDMLVLEPTRLECVALRDIAAGEEFTMSYLYEQPSRAARQRTLRGDYGFRCKCVRCEDEKGKSRPGTAMSRPDTSVSRFESSTK